jgi:hypothetical protein
VLPGVRARVVFGYRKAGGTFPLFEAYPWQLDVKFPVGEQPGGTKAFELPPGRSETYYEPTPLGPFPTWTRTAWGPWAGPGAATP